MRALWTAATGMRGQQFNIDTIANNLSNVNTTSYKTQRAEFKDLFYTTLKRTNLTDEEGRPVNLEVGHGLCLQLQKDLEMVVLWRPTIHLILLLMEKVFCSNFT